MAKTSTDLWNLSVDFGNVSIGDGTARVGITISRQSLSLEDADTILCGKRLTGRIVACGDDDPNQKQLFADGLPEVMAVFDCKQFAATPKAIKSGLTFSLDGLDLGSLDGFAKQSGRMLVSAVRAVEEADPEAEGEAWDDDDPDADEDGEAADENDAAAGVAPMAKASVDWKKMSIAELTINNNRSRNAFVSACEKKGCKTLGKFSAFQAKHGDWWPKELEIGPKCRQDVEDAWVAFWKRHPECCADAA